MGRHRDLDRAHAAGRRLEWSEEVGRDGRCAVELCAVEAIDDDAPVPDLEQDSHVGEVRELEGRGVLWGHALWGHALWGRALWDGSRPTRRAGDQNDDAGAREAHREVHCEMELALMSFHTNLGCGERRAPFFVDRIVRSGKKPSWQI